MSFELYGITEDLLNKLSYESKMGKSLKNTLRKFDKDELTNELLDLKEALRNVLSSCKEV